VIKSGWRHPGVLIVTVLAAAVLGVLPATAQPGQAQCAATAPKNLLNPFASLGDNAQYVQASSGVPLLADGATLTANCTRTPGIQSIVRFYARNLSGTGAIHVEILANHGKDLLDGGLVTAPSTLTALNAVVIPWDRNGRGATDLQVRLTAVGGSFEIGDVYVDPFVMR
jgi:hypothetical protein